MNPTGSSLAEWLARLETFSPHEIVLGLERVQLLLERLDLNLPPHVLHFGGTNGKGSSVAMAEALFRQSDLLVGAYTSPHILQFNERIRIDGEPVADAEIVTAFERIEALRGTTALTYFEFGTIAAVVIFEARSVDLALLEVGMGGRLDAVNAIEPSASLITNVSLDHCDWLGNDVETIALEKAGIMRKDKPVVYGSPDVPASILSHADELGAHLLLAGRDFIWQRQGEEWSWAGQYTRLDGLRAPALRGAFQIQNAAGVLALLESAGFSSILDDKYLNQSFSSLKLAGRMQSLAADRNWLLDVAHNPAAAEILSSVLRADSFGGRTIAIVAMLDDKDVSGVITPLLDQVDSWIAVTANSDRAINAEELARRVANITNKGCLIAETLSEAIDFAHEISDVDDRVLATGSFYLLGPVLEALKIYSPQLKGAS